MTHEGSTKRNLRKLIRFTAFLALPVSLAGGLLISVFWAEQYVVACALSLINFIFIGGMIPALASRTHRSKTFLVSAMKILFFYGGGVFYYSSRGFSAGAFIAGFNTPFLLIVIGAIVGALHDSGEPGDVHSEEGTGDGAEKYEYLTGEDE